jgi:adenylyltransferase/sulfurtransferase
MSDHSDNSNLARYDRQMRFAPLAEDGQRRLLDSRALVCGCGALGTVIANTLARAGVGHLRIVDRDFIELNNLQRQVLFDEDDLAAGLPKAIAAANKLRRINSTIEIDPIVTDVNHTNVLALCEGVKVIVDGTDNFETRFLLNDAAHKLRIPWV